MTDFLTSSGRDAILQDMYSAHNCTPLAASVAAGMGREKFKKEQKRREKERDRCNQALGWYCKAAESGAVMETDGEAVKAAWAFVPLLVKLLWPMVAEALLKWIWGRVR